MNNIVDYRCKLCNGQLVDCYFYKYCNKCQIDPKYLIYYISFDIENPHRGHRELVGIGKKYPYIIYDHDQQNLSIFLSSNNPLFYENTTFSIPEFTSEIAKQWYQYLSKLDKLRAFI